MGALLGIVGTYVYPSVLKCLRSLPRTGSLSLWLFALFISPAGLAFAFEKFTDVDMTVHGQSVTPYIMLYAVAISRVWLWCFDLAECQIMQENIEESERGIINSVQTAMYQIFWVLLSIQGMIFSDPSEFYILTIMSVVTVCLSAMIFSLWASGQSLDTDNLGSQLHSVQTTLSKLVTEVASLKSELAASKKIGS